MLRKAEMLLPAHVGVGLINAFETTSSHRQRIRIHSSS